MTKRLLAVYLVLIVLLAAFIPGCTPTPTTGTIEVKATLDGAPWPSSGTGAVDYTLTGPAGTSSINGTEVPDTFTVAAGDWTCAYVSGGPGTFVDITPSATQSVAVNGTKTFTLNFVTPVPPLDAYIQFESWTINGQRVPPGQYQIDANTIIDIEYSEHVSGEQGTNVTLHQTCWLQIHYIEGIEQPLWIHVVNHPDAVKMNPPAKKLSQECTVEGVPYPACTEIPLFICEPVLLDVEIDWELEICTQYTKTINWLGFPSPPDILFDAGGLMGILPPGTTFNLIAKACINLEGDENPDNDCTDWCEPLIVTYAPAL